MSGKDIVTALVAGATASKAEGVPPAVRDRFNALRRAISRHVHDIVFGDLEDREGLAKTLDDHAADHNRAIVTTANELLMLIKLEDKARAAVEPMMPDIEHAHTVLSSIDLDERSERAASSRTVGDIAAKVATPPSPARAPAKEPEPPPAPKPPPTTSRRFAPPEEPSKTELERTALPIWQRTDRFFTKAAILFVAYVAAFLVYWFFIRTNDAMDRCRAGEAPRCWEVVAVQDTLEQSKKVQIEPLQLLCDKYNDPCGCAGVAYLKAADSSQSADCSEIQRASQLDPTWPCTCTRYGFWRYGKDRTAQCGVTRCD